jgi:hypothetical protein
MSSFQTDTSPGPGDKRLSVNVEHLLEKKVCAQQQQQQHQQQQQRAHCIYWSNEVAAFSTFSLLIARSGRCRGI